MYWTLNIKLRYQSAMPDWMKSFGYIIISYQDFI